MSEKNAQNFPTWLSVAASERHTHLSLFYIFFYPTLLLIKSSPHTHNNIQYNMHMWEEVCRVFKEKKKEWTKKKSERERQSRSKEEGNSTNNNRQLLLPLTTIIAFSGKDEKVLWQFSFLLLSSVAFYCVSNITLETLILIMDFSPLTFPSFSVSLSLLCSWKFLFFVFL